MIDNYHMNNAEEKATKKWSITGLFRRKKKPKTHHSPLANERFDYIAPVASQPTAIKYPVAIGFARNSQLSGSLDSYTKKQYRKRAEQRRFANFDDSSDDDDSASSSAVICDNDSSCSSSKRTRAARTERYIRRVSRDESLHGSFNQMGLPWEKIGRKFDARSLSYDHIGGDKRDFHHTRPRADSHVYANHEAFQNRRNFSFKPEGSPSPPAPPPRDPRRKNILHRYFVDANRPISCSLDRNHEIPAHAQIYRDNSSLKLGDPLVLDRVNFPDSDDDVEISARKTTSPISPISIFSDRASRPLSSQSLNFEQALNELDEIYNSLQMDDSLLDRAEHRDMTIHNHLVEEHQRKSATPQHYDDEPDAITDDVVYRKMNQYKTPTPTPTPSDASQISYLLLSNAEFPLDTPKIQGEPDVTLDDVVYRNVHQQRNSLKVLDPQPPFGIPLGPVSPAPDSDYLHVKLEAKTRGDTPDVVADDLAVRRLRRDRFGGSLLDVKGNARKSATRSMSTNVYDRARDSESPVWTNNKVYEAKASELDRLLIDLAQQTHAANEQLNRELNADFGVMLEPRCEYDVMLVNLSDSSDDDANGRLFFNDNAAFAFSNDTYI